MAKRIFFSFHYDDVKTFRANVVRNHWLTKEDRKDAGFFDASIWEDAKRHGDDSVKRLINSNLENTSVTCVLIGSQTFERRWVKYEILKSYYRDNSLFGIHINSIKDKNQLTFTQGKNPFDYLGLVVDTDGSKFTYYEYNGNDWVIYRDLPPKKVTNINKEHWGKGFKLSNWVKCYDWSIHNGYDNFAEWVENS